jgi:hypothetical protein
VSTRRQGPRFAALALVFCFGTNEAVAAATLAGVAEVTTATARGARFAVGAGRCGDAVVSEWRDAAGRIVAHEQVDLQGESWVRYRLRRDSVAQEVQAVREGDRVRVQIRNGAHARTISLPAQASMIAGPLLVPFLQERLPELRRGAPLEFAYLVADQGLTLQLRASMQRRDGTGVGERAGSAPGVGVTVIRLEAASLLMRPFVPPTMLEFDAAGQFVGMQGRLLPQLGSPGQPQSLDGVMRVRDEPMQSSCHMRNLS